MSRPPSHPENSPDDPSWDRDDADESPVAWDAQEESESDDGPGDHDTHLTDDHEPDLTDCAGCGKRILAEATRCHHCGVHFVGEAWQQHIAGASPRVNRWIVGTALVLLAALLLTMAASTLARWGGW